GVSTRRAAAGCCSWARPLGMGAAARGEHSGKFATYEIVGLDSVQSQHLGLAVFDGDERLDGVLVSFPDPRHDRCDGFVESGEGQLGDLLGGGGSDQLAELLADLGDPLLADPFLFGDPPLGFSVAGGVVDPLAASPVGWSHSYPPSSRRRSSITSASGLTRMSGHSTAGSHSEVSGTWARTTMRWCSGRP